MPIYGIVQQGTIGPAIVADTIEDAVQIGATMAGDSAVELVPNQPPYQGWRWDGEKFYDPTPEPIELSE